MKGKRSSFLSFSIYKTEHIRTDDKQLHLAQCRCATPDSRQIAEITICCSLSYKSQQPACLQGHVS